MLSDSVSGYFNNIQGTDAPVYDIRDLRKIRAELAEIKEEILHSDRQDSLSQEIALWCETFETFFIETLNSDLDLKPIIQNAVILMERILRCPLPPHAFLDEGALLGSDGNVYNSESLNYYRSHANEACRERSPLNASDPTPFTTQPHNLARFMARWLSQQEYHREQVNQLEQRNLEASIQEIDLELEEAGGNLLQRLESSRSRRRARAAREAEREVALRVFENEIREGIDQEMDRHLTALSNESHRNLDISEEVIRGLSQEVLAVADLMENTQREREEEEANMRRRIENLNENIMQNERGIRRVEISTAQLEKGIDDLNRKLDERDKKQSKSLLKTILIAAACIAISLCLPPASGGASGGVAPVSNGFKIFGSIPF